MAGQVGWKSEPTFGAGGVVDKFQPALAWNISVNENHMRPAGIRAGRRTKVAAKLGARDVSGQLRLELPNVDFAVMFKHMFGSVATTGVGPYTHTGTPGAQTGANKSLVMQGVITDETDTLQPFTASGTKINGWELAAQVGQFAELALDWTARDVALYRLVTDGDTTSGSPTVTSVTAAFTAADLFKPISGAGIPAGSYIGKINSGTSVELSSTNTVHTPANASATASGVSLTLGVATAAASYAATLSPFTFLEASVTLGGTLVASARAVRLRAAKGLRTDRHVLGSRYIREQLEQDRWTFDGSITLDFENVARVRQAAAASELALVLAFSTAPTGGTDALTITANVQLPEVAQSLTTNGLEEQTINFEVGHATSDASAITAVLVNADSSAV